MINHAGLWLTRARNLPTGDPMSALEDFVVDSRRVRPPTVVYPDRHQMARYRDKEFPPTVVSGRRVVEINLEGGLFSPGALEELVLPLAQGIRNGTYGPLVLVVVSSDQAAVDFLESLANRHDVTFYIKPSTDTPLTQAQPVGALTASDTETLKLIQDFGPTTSSNFAEAGGLEVNAAVNRLSKLARKGFVYRVARPRREGDVFLDPRAGAEAWWSRALAEPKGLIAAGNLDVAIEIPAALSAQVWEWASAEGAMPAELLTQAWSEYADRHRERLDAESAEVGRMMQEGDQEGLADYVTRGARRWAEQMSPRDEDGV
jgi:hypothetical protein